MKLINTNHSTKSNTMITRIKRDQYRKVRELTCTATRMLTAKYLPPTNTRGARIKIIDRWFEQSITIPFNYCFNSSVAGAVDYLVANGWEVAGVNSEAHGKEAIIIIKEWDSTQQLRG